MRASSAVIIGLKQGTGYAAFLISSLSGTWQVNGPGQWVTSFACRYLVCADGSPTPAGPFFASGLASWVGFSRRRKRAAARLISVVRPYRETSVLMRRPLRSDAQWRWLSVLMRYQEVFRQGGLRHHSSGAGLSALLTTCQRIATDTILYYARENGTSSILQVTISPVPLPATLPLFPAAWQDWVGWEGVGSPSPAPRKGHRDRYPH